jgi:hypothetical protein
MFFRMQMKDSEFLTDAEKQAIDIAPRFVRYPEFAQRLVDVGGRFHL